MPPVRLVLAASEREDADMGRRTRDRILGLVIGIMLGWAGGSSRVQNAPAQRDSGDQSSEDSATRDFLRAPAGKIHLRAVPKFAARDLQHHYADLGSLETYDDALFEFFREDSRRWLVNLWKGRSERSSFSAL